MDAMAQDPITQKLLLDWFLDLDTPEGLRAELVEGELVVTAVPDGHHEPLTAGVLAAFALILAGSVLATAAPRRPVTWSTRQTSRADGRVESP